MPEEVTVIELKHLATGLAAQPSETEVSSSWAEPARRGKARHCEGYGSTTVGLPARSGVPKSVGRSPAVAVPTAANTSDRARRALRDEFMA